MMQRIEQTCEMMIKSGTKRVEDKARGREMWSRNIYFRGFNENEEHVLKISVHAREVKIYKYGVQPNALNYPCVFYL